MPNHLSPWIAKAVKSGSIKIVKPFLEHNKDNESALNATEKTLSGLILFSRTEGYSLAHLAVIHKQYELLELFGQYENMMLDATDSNGQMPIEYAVAAHDAKAVRILLQYVDPNTLNPFTNVTASHAAAWHKDEEIAQLLLDRGARTDIGKQSAESLARCTSKNIAKMIFDHKQQASTCERPRP